MKSTNRSNASPLKGTIVSPTHAALSENFICSLATAPNANLGPLELGIPFLCRHFVLF